LIPKFGPRLGDTAAIQAKLDELIRATEGHPALVGIEERTEEEMARIKEERSHP
jgi:low affinity Fe/Cu permease